MGLFKKRSGEKRRRIKVLFATDLHGSEHTFGKLLGALNAWRPDAIVVGGDVAGKGLMPIHVDGDRARVRWMGDEHDVALSELPEYERLGSQLGFYPYRGSAEELQALHDDDAHAEQVFDRLMYERWERWIERLEARCAELEVPAYLIAGNDDPWNLDELTFAERRWAHGADGRVLPLSDDWTLISCGLANQTPWECPRDVPEETLKQELEKLAEQAGDFTSVIANIHVPPHGSSLDIAPELDTSVSPPRAIAGSTASVGSRAVAAFLAERQPLLSLHGHIHESPGAVEIGRTKAINPGSEYAEGVLRAVLVTLEPERVVGHQFVTG